MCSICVEQREFVVVCCQQQCVCDESADMREGERTMDEVHKLIMTSSVKVSGAGDNLKLI